MADLEDHLKASVVIRDITELLQDQTHTSYRLEQWLIDYKEDVPLLFAGDEDRIRTIRRCMKNVMKEMATLIADATAHVAHLDPEHID